MRRLRHDIPHDLTGEATGAQARALRALPLEHTDELVISLAGVRRVDAQGIALLMRLASFMRRHDRTLRICDVHERLHRLLHHFEPLQRVMTAPVRTAPDLRPRRATA